jgi:hypothetical protein
MMDQENSRGAALQPIAALILTMSLFAIWGLGSD